MTKQITELERQTIIGDEVEQANYNALVGLIAQHGLWIRARDLHNWRPTVRETGDIIGVKECIEIIATDGNLGYFLTEDQVFCGHIQHFTGEVKRLFRKPKEGVIKEKKRLSPADKLLEKLLKGLKK